MKKLLLTLIAVSAISAHAAETPAKSKQVEELLAITDASAMVETMYNQLEISLREMATQMGVNGAEQQVFDEYQAKMVQLMRSELNWEKIKDPIKAIYTEHFSEKQIKDMIAFYKTETGKQTLEKMPVIVQESMAVSQEAAAGIMPKMQEMARQLAAEIEQMRLKEGEADALMDIKP